MYFTDLQYCTDIDILLGHLVYCHIQILIFLIQNLYMTIIEE